MISRRLVVSALLLLFSASLVKAQLFKKQLNAYDNDGLKTGTWKLFWDDEKKIPMSMATYDNGRETGVSKEYHYNGQLRLKFRHQKKRTRVKYYSMERKLEQKGWAVFDYSSGDIRYYWDGKWKFYNENRNVINVSSYKNGELISETYLGN